MQHLMNVTSNVIGHDVSIADYKTVHGWQYANNAERENCHMFLDTDLKLAACGDWCLGGRVEGHALLLEDPGRGVADIAILVGDEPIEHLDDGDRGSHGVVEVGELHADGT